MPAFQFFANHIFLNVMIVARICSLFDTQRVATRTQYYMLTTYASFSYKPQEATSELVHHFISSIKPSTQHILIQRVLLSIKITSAASQQRFPIDLCTKNITCRISKQRSLQHQGLPLQASQSAPRELKAKTRCFPTKLSAAAATPRPQQCTRGDSR